MCYIIILLSSLELFLNYNIVNKKLTHIFLSKLSDINNLFILMYEGIINVLQLTSR